MIPSQRDNVDVVAVRHEYIRTDGLSVGLCRLARDRCERDRDNVPGCLCTKLAPPVTNIVK